MHFKIQMHYCKCLRTLVPGTSSVKRGLVCLLKKQTCYFFYLFSSKMNCWMISADLNSSFCTENYFNIIKTVCTDLLCWLHSVALCSGSGVFESLKTSTNWKNKKFYEVMCDVILLKWYKLNL